MNCILCGEEFGQKMGQTSIACPICLAAQTEHGYFWGYEEISHDWENETWWDGQEDAKEFCQQMKGRFLPIHEIKNATKNGYYPPGMLIRFQDSIYQVRKHTENGRAARRRCDMVYLREENSSLPKMSKEEEE